MRLAGRAAVVTAAAGVLDKTSLWLMRKKALMFL